MPTPDTHHALIIGVGPGLGLAVARRFAREGFSLTLVARSEQGLAAHAEELRGSGTTVETVSADAADVPGFRAALEELAQRTTPGVVVYNAALVAADDVLTSDAEHLQSAHAIDVLSAISTAQVFTPAMREAGAGTFLATGGYAGVDPQPAYATISLGKAGLRTAVALMHDALAADGVHAASVQVVGAITPGTALDPDRIAESYWALHTRDRADWAPELVFDGS